MNLGLHSSQLERVQQCYSSAKQQRLYDLGTACCPPELRAPLLCLPPSYAGGQTDQLQHTRMMLAVWCLLSEEEVLSGTLSDPP